MKKISVAEYGARYVAMTAIQARELGLEEEWDCIDDYDSCVFWTSPESLVKSLKGRAWPGEVFACDEVRMNLVATDIVDAAIEQGEMHEGATDHITTASVVELQALLDAWMAKHTEKVVSWTPDRTITVVP